MEAAEIALCEASPSTMARARQASSGQWVPSIRASCGATLRASTARRMARSEARKMLMASISSTLANATAQATARSRMRPASSSRRSAVSTFESARPFPRRAGSRITAAAYTGPASGPLPASSTPQTTSLSALAIPLLVHYLEHRVRGLLRRILSQHGMEVAEARDLPLARLAVAQEREQRIGQRLRRGLVLQQLRHQLLAGEDIGHAHIRQVCHLPHDCPADRRLPVSDDPPRLDQRPLAAP